MVVAEVWSWGRNKSGQLGVGDYRQEFQSPFCDSKEKSDRDRINPVKVCSDLGDAGLLMGFSKNLVRGHPPVTDNPDELGFQRLACKCKFQPFRLRSLPLPLGVCSP